jgi:hypothetical protein
MLLTVGRSSGFFGFERVEEAPALFRRGYQKTAAGISGNTT